MPVLAALGELPGAQKAIIYAIGAAAVVLILLGVFAYGIHYGSAECKAAAANAAIKAQKQADSLAEQLIRTENAAREATAKTTTVYKDRIVNAPQTNSCGPALRDARDGVCALIHGGCAPAK